MIYLKYRKFYVHVDYGLSGGIVMNGIAFNNSKPKGSLGVEGARRARKTIEEMLGIKVDVIRVVQAEEVIDL